MTPCGGAHVEQYQTGTRWPHQICREMFQSRMLVIQCSYTPTHFSGRRRTRPVRTAASAGSANGAMRTNHWSLSRGSTTVSQR